MIWNSIPLMTAIDLLIIAVTVYAIWRCRLVGPSKRPSAPQTGLRLIVLGLVVEASCDGVHGHSPSECQLVRRILTIN